jgi:hypothetical protein
MSQTITVKCLFNTDIRRFPVSVNCSWSNFINILSKLYETDITALRLTYRDEEGDDIAVTTDDELLEAFRLAQESNPPLLRLLVAPANLTVSVNSQNLLNSVLGNPVQVPGKKLSEVNVASTSIKESPPVNVAPIKVASSIKESSPVIVASTSIKETHPPVKVPEVVKPIVVKNEKKEEEKAAQIPVVYVSGRAYVPKPSVQAPQKPYTGPTKNPSTPSQPQALPKPTMVSINNKLAESISSLVLESSDSTLVSSTLFSDAISEQSQKLSDQTVDSNMEIARVISFQTNQLCNESEATELDDAIRRSLSDVCHETGSNSAKLSDKIAAMTSLNSNQISEDIQPISSSTRNIQDVAVEGLEDNLSRKVDDIVRDIMSATKIN